MPHSEYEGCPGSGLGNISSTWETTIPLLAAVGTSTNGDFQRVSAAGRDSSGNPVIKYRDGGDNHTAIWNGSSWDRTDIGINFSETPLLIDRNNVWVTAAGATYRRSTNDGSSWTNANHGSSSSYNKHDIRYFKMTCKIRDTHATISGGNITGNKIEFVEYVNPDWTRQNCSPNIWSVVQNTAQFSGDCGGALTSATENGTGLTDDTNHITASGATLNIDFDDCSFDYTPAASIDNKGETDVVTLVFQ